MSKAGLEAFSDGVIAIPLLILEIKVPEGAGDLPGAGTMRPPG